MKKTIMVTGASGYIGRHVVSALLAKGADVIAVDLVNRGIPVGATVCTCNLLEDQVFQMALPQVDAIIHLAWQDGFVHNAPSHIANLSKHLDFIKMMVDRGVKQIAVMGSMHEVGYWEGAIDENTPCNPLSMYGIAKNALRQALFTQYKGRDVVLQWLRGFYIYGDDRQNHSIFTKLLEAAEAGKEKFPFTSGKNKYDFMPIEKFAECIALTILQQEVAGIINCCSGNPISLAEAVENFIKLHGLSIKLDYGAFPDRPYDSPGIWGDPTKINNIIQKAN